MAPEATSVSVPTADGAMPSLLWVPDVPDDSRGSALVVFQEIFGVSDYIRDRCADLADLGYVVLAPELYWRLPVQRVDEDDEDLLEQGMALISQLDWDTAVRDGVSALQHTASLPHVDRVGALGFCLGGGLAYAATAAAAAAPSALVSYYGSALPQLVDAGIEVDVPSLHHFGTADSYIPLETVEAIRAWVTRGDNHVEFELYEGAGHAFDNPNPLFHHPEAAASAWESTVSFLTRQMPVE